MGLFNRKGTPAHSVTLSKDATGAPATHVDLVKDQGGVDMVKKFSKAGTSLSKRGLNGIRAEVVMLLDHSLSMDGNYRNGTVQTLVERALGFALQVDYDGTIPVIRFDRIAHPAIEVTLSNYADVARASLYEREKMHNTNLTGALDAVLRHAPKIDKPLYVVVITDGRPNDARSAAQAVQTLASYPVFLKFLAVPDRGEFPGKQFLQDLDDMGGRLVDNADSKFIDDPAGMTDLAFAEAMVDELDTWFTAATRAGLLR